MRIFRLVSPFLVGLVLLLAGRSVEAAVGFPPITEQERALTAVPGEPNAPAVVLFRKGEQLMSDYGFGASADFSYMRVQARIKILTVEGAGKGEITIFHGDGSRLQHFEGRTVLADGRIIPVPADARFSRKISRSRRMSATAIAFPSVQAGAILDYRYEIKVESLLVSEPWYFSDDIPVRFSEIVFKTAPYLQVTAWSRSPKQGQIQITTGKTASGYVTRGWAENLSAVADEPYGPPYDDLASQMLLLPTALATGWSHRYLYSSWPRVCELLGQSYDRLRRRAGGVAEAARDLVAGKSDSRARSEALYRFVRDEIATVPPSGVHVSPVSSLLGTFNERQGRGAAKALLLQAMLAAVQIDADLVWAADRDLRTIDPKLPTPDWFDAVFVRIELDGTPVFLDPADPALGFGQLRAGYEGAPALLFDPKEPEEIVLPRSPFEQNLRRAEIELDLNDEGRLSGQGTLLLTGHAAWGRIDWKNDEAQTLQAWKDWLSERFREFQISDVKVIESPDDRKVTLTWTLAQREEEVLGDEITLMPSAPLGPVAQPFAAPAASRRTSVLLDYPFREEVELRLRWPEGWEVASSPEAKVLLNPAGRLTAEIEIRDQERLFVYRRQMDLPRRELRPNEYGSLRAYYDAVEKSDAQKLLLVRR